MQNFVDDFQKTVIYVPPLRVRCVYGLLSKKKIVYIGSTVNFAKRISGHIARNDKKFDQYCFLKIPESVKIENVEAELIRIHQPMYNAGLPMNELYYGEAGMKQNFFNNRNLEMRKFLTEHNINPFFRFKSMPYYKASEIQKGLNIHDVDALLIGTDDKNLGF